MGNGIQLLGTQSSPNRSGSVVVITGASSGIGAALSYRYAKRKSKLILAARSRPQLEIVAAKCRDLGAKNVYCLPTDVTDENACHVLIDFTIRMFTRIDLLVLNAGVSSHFPFDNKVDVQVYRQIMDTNFFGYLHCTKHAWQHLVSSGGQILVVSSMSGEIGLPERSAYCAAKFAVNGFFDSLVMEQQARKEQNPVTITVVCPPSVNTDMRNHAIKTQNQTCIGDPLNPRHTGMDLDDCVTAIIRACDERATKVHFPTKSALAVLARPFLPSIIDPLIQKASKL